MSDNYVTIASAARSSVVDTTALEQVLRRHIRGDVRFDSGSRALYATDGSNYRQVPIGVVLPRDADDVIAAVSLARDYGAPLLCRGSGTSLAGQCCNVALVLDFTRYMGNILEIDPQRRTARVQPGVVLDHLRNAAEKHHLTFGPDPASHDRCTLGGMIGNNSCGVHSVMAGKTDDNIEALEVLTYDGLRMKVGKTSDAELEQIIHDGGRRGEIYAGLKKLRDQYANLVRQRYPNIPRRVSGYNLNFLLPENGLDVARALVGSEGTCVSVLEATCRLVESPPARVLLVIAYPDIYQCADHVPDVMAHKPIGLEGIDDLLVEYTRRRGINSEGLALLPEGGGWLLAEFGADTIAAAEAQASSLMHALNRGPNPPKLRLFTNREQVKRVWEVRESSLGVISYIPGEDLTWEGWEDSAVAPEKLGKYLRELRQLMTSFNYRGTLYGHFGHGCVHNRTNFDLQSEKGIAKFRKFMEAAADLVVSYGGSLSGEHGDGQARRDTLARLRNEVAPVDAAVLGALPAALARRRLGARRQSARLREAIDQLEGLALPFSELERVILPARVPDFQPRMLDELGAAGEVVWVGQGALGSDDGRVIALSPRARRVAASTCRPAGPSCPSRAARGDPRRTSPSAAPRSWRSSPTPPPRPDAVVRALWDLAWLGLVTNDTFAPLRTLGRTSRGPRGRFTLPAGGRWSTLASVVGAPPADTVRAHTRALVLLERYGVVSREAAAAESLAGGFASVSGVLRAMEESGKIRRGHFVDGLQGAQFAHAAAVDRLRAARDADGDAAGPRS